MRCPCVLRVAALAAVVLAGCPGRTRSVGMPELPSQGDAAARARFQEARTRFDRDGNATASEFTAIAAEYPDDPIVSYAQLYAGMAALRAGEPEKAQKPLSELTADEDAPQPLRRRGRFFLGLSEAYLGHGERALALLDDQDAVLDDEERGERWAALAGASAQAGRPVDALRAFDRFFSLARPAERAYVLDRVRALVDALPAADLAGAYRAIDHDGPAGALVGARLASDLTAQNDADGAARVRAETADARRAAGLEPEPGAAALPSAGERPSLVGAVLPLSGKRARLGALVARGLALASGAFADAATTGAAGGVPRPFTVVLRDTRSEAAASADAVAGLLSDGAIAVIGPLDRQSLDAAAPRADAAAAPLLALDPSEGDDAPSPYLFHVLLSPETRARALARAAFSGGARTFVVLGPDTGYGKSTGRAFRAEIERLGGHVLGESWYAAGETTFGGAVRAVAGKPFDAVFVPDTAQRLELVAPALAAANLIALPAAARAPRRGRRILLLSTAEALSPAYLRGSGRYSLGALFAPGFYPDDADPRIGAYVTRFQAAFGGAPTYLDAYAYDAALLIRAAVEAGAHTRAEVAAALADSRLEGLTGPIRFGPGHHRSDDGVLYTVRDEAGTPAIRAVRAAATATAAAPSI